MATKKITLKLTLEVDTGDAEIVDVQIDEVASAAIPPTDSRLPNSVENMIEENASPAMAELQMAFADRCLSQLGLDLQTPTGDRKYVNAYPPKRYGAKRAAAFDVKSGRVEIYCRPENAAGRQFAKVVTNNGEPFAVKVYLHSEQAVDEAVELTRVGLSEREG